MAIIPLPDKLMRLAHEVNQTCSRCAMILDRVGRDRKEWIETIIEIGLKLREAREEFKDNISFGQWCDDHHFPLGKDERANLIDMAVKPDVMRTVFEASESWSIRMIYQAHSKRFLSAEKTVSSALDDNHDLSKSQKWRKEFIENKGTLELKAIFADGKLPLFTCYEIARLSPEVQSSTIERKLADPKIRAPNRKRSNDPAPQPKSRVQPRINPPIYTAFANDAPLTAAEAEHPGSDATFAEKQRWRDKVGHFLFRPVAIEELLEHDRVTSDCSGRVVRLGDKDLCSPEDFFQRLDKMLAYVPIPERGRGTEIDFAKKARASLRRLEDNLKAAREWLQQFEAALAKRTYLTGD